MPDSADSNAKPDGDASAIRHLKQAVNRGENWYIALLESIQLWNSPEEIYRKRRYKYLIEGEAFDWLLLAERLIMEIAEFVPEQERINLLFFDKPPVSLEKEKFKKLIGPAKYKAYLNYLYGVIIEEALVLSVVAEVRKEQRVLGYTRHSGEQDKAFKRIYRAGYEEMLDIFRTEKKYRKLKTTSLGELKEYYYWLFKYRLKHAEKSLVASDTKRALIFLQNNPTLRKILY